MSRSPIAIIFLTAFIDMLGIGIVIPVISALFFNVDTELFDPSVTQTRRSILFGFLVAAYPVMQFFGAPLLGALSDRYGRKPVLSIALAGTLVGYLLFALAIVWQNLPLLFISRMIPGFTGGNISILFSAIADISDPQSRTRNFGMVGMAFALGFILGPTIGGILADDSLVSWFSHATPFFVTAGLTAVNLLWVQWQFPETLKKKQLTPIDPLTGLRNIRYALATPSLRTIFLVVLLLSLGFTFFTQFFSVFLIQKFQFSEGRIGMLFGWIGLWLAFTQGFTVRQLSRRVSSPQVLQFSILLLALALAVVAFPEQGYLFYFINPFIATFQGITSPNLTSVISSQATPDQQGRIMGINQSMLSLGQSIPPLVGGYVNTIDGRLPMLIAAGLTLLAWGMYMVYYRRTQRPTNS